MRLLPLDILLHAGDGESTRGLHDASGVVKDVFDSSTDFVIRHPHDLVDDLESDRKGVGSHFPDRNAVGENADMLETDTRPFRERLIHRVGFKRLDPDDAHFGRKRLDERTNPSNQPATSHRHKNRREITARVAENLVTNRPLPRNDERIVERMHEGESLLRADLVAPRLGIGVGVTSQNNFRAHGPHGVDFDRRRRERHDDHSAHIELPRSVGDPLGVVTSARRDHAFFELVLRQMRHLVVGAADLEAEDRLQVFAFEKNFVAQPARKLLGRLKRRLARDIVDATRQNRSEQIVDGLFALFGHEYG